MNLCFPVTGIKGLTETIFSHFGSAPYFLIYDTDTKSITTIRNDNQHHSHGTCQPFGIISHHDIDAVITNGMGKRAVQLLNGQGLKVYLLEDETVEEAIGRFESGSLREMQPQEACGGHGCH